MGVNEAGIAATLEKILLVLEQQALLQSKTNEFMRLLLVRLETIEQQTKPPEVKLGHGG